MKRAALLTTTFVALTAAWAPRAEAETASYCDFSDTTGLDINGYASVQTVGGFDVVDLAPSMKDKAGSVFLTAPVSLPAGVSFHTYFGFVIGPDITGGHGVAFVLHNAPEGPQALGGDAGQMGYGGISPSVVVEFDTYENTWDPDGNHVAVMLDGDYKTHYVAADPGFDLAGGGAVNVWIDYDGVSTELDVYVADTETKPTAPLVTYSIDIGAHLGGSAYVGLTSATGTLTDDHYLALWEFSTDGVPCACDGDAICGDAASGMVCGDSSSVCEGGCRGMDGNGCPSGLDCSSTDATEGTCETESTSASSSAASTAAASTATASSVSAGPASSVTASSSAAASTGSGGETTSSTSSSTAATTGAGGAPGSSTSSHSSSGGGSKETPGTVGGGGCAVTSSNERDFSDLALGLVACAFGARHRRRRGR